MPSRVRFVGLALTLLVFGAAPAIAHAQRLGDVSRAVHGSGSSSGGGSHTSSSAGGSSSRGYGSSGYGVYGGSGNGGAVMAGWVPLYYPYYLGHPGWYVAQSTRIADRPYVQPDVIGIVDASAGYVFDSIGRGQVSALVRIGGLLDLQLRYGAYFEQTTDQIRALGIGRLAGAYGVVTTDAVQLRIGVAGLLYHDVAGVELGAGGGVELDIYPVEPLVLRGELYAGILGQASMVDGRVTIGVQIERGELYLGYQVLGIFPAGDAIVLHGPMAGVRIWIS